jgi:hypothetical protein
MARDGRTTHEPPAPTQRNAQTIAVRLLGSVLWRGVGRRDGANGDRGGAVVEFELGGRAVEEEHAVAGN